MDPALEEAARSLGSGAWTTFFRVTLPQTAACHRWRASLLVALYSLSDFGAVSLLQYDSFSREIYIQYQSAFDRTPAAILALMLVGSDRGDTARSRAAPAEGHATTRGSTARPATPVALGRWRWPALFFCAGRRVPGARRSRSACSASGSCAGSPRESPCGRCGTPRGARSTSRGWQPAPWRWPRFRWRSSRCGSRGGARGSWSGWRTSGYALPGIVLALSLVFFGANYAPWALPDARRCSSSPTPSTSCRRRVGATRAALLQVSPQRGGGGARARAGSRRCPRDGHGAARRLRYPRGRRAGIPDHHEGAARYAAPEPDRLRDPSDAASGPRRTTLSSRGRAAPALLLMPYLGRPDVPARRSGSARNERRGHGAPLRREPELRTGEGGAASVDLEVSEG